MRPYKLNLSIFFLLYATLVLSACEGPIGPAGSPGVDGVNGEDGADGDPGAPGMNGEDGEPGAPGMDGETGAPGAPGVDGEDGVDGVCAGRELLEITGVEGLPETLYEYQRVTLNVVSNVADPTSLSFSVPTGGQAIFTDLGDGSLSLVTGGESTDIERFTMFATDGCTIATYTFELGRIFPSPASMINVVNLTESDIDVWSALVIEDVGEVAHLEISYLGLDAGDVDSERPIKSGENVIRVFDEGDVDHPADGFEPESLLGELSVTIEPGRYYLLMLEEDEAETGGVNSALFDMGPEPINAQGVLSVSHQMTDSEPVSVFTVDESVEPPMTAEVISALEYGQSSEPLAMPESSYVFGVDLDMDGEVDVNLPEFEIKDRTRNLVIVNPLETACYTGPSFTIVNASTTSFSSEVSVWVPEPPPSDVIVPINSGQVDGEALLDALPYAVSYTSQENVRVGDSSYRQINAPIGTAQIRLGVSFDVEVFWDKFVVYNRDRELIYRDDGAELCVEIIVPGDIAILGVDSDSNTEGSGYIIKALSFD